MRGDRQAVKGIIAGNLWGITVLKKDDVRVLTRAALSNYVGDDLVRLTVPEDAPVEDEDGTWIRVAVRAEAADGSGYVRLWYYESMELEKDDDESNRP